jgi:catechol 2,3-dioxygenase-like lactoylglutathione lyase family enzyme
MAIAELRVALTVDDYDKAIAFYRDGLGMEVGPAWEGSGRAQVLGGGKAMLEIFDNDYAKYVDEMEVGARLSGKVRFALEVPDIHAALKRAIAHGGSLVHQPVETPWKDLNARVEAPDGMQITLYQLINK